MISIDTNILARSVLNDDEVQSPIAQEKIRKILRHEEIFIASFSILELVWLMRVKKKSKETILSVLHSLLNTSGLVVGNDKEIRFALTLFRKGTADFGDYLILSESLQNGCEKVLTFDKKFSKENYVDLI